MHGLFRWGWTGRDGAKTVDLEHMLPVYRWGVLTKEKGDARCLVVGCVGLGAGGKGRTR